LYPTERAKANEEMISKGCTTEAFNQLGGVTLWVLSCRRIGGQEENE
jgi:hypothetical protein